MFMKWSHGVDWFTESNLYCCIPALPWQPVRVDHHLCHEFCSRNYEQTQKSAKSTAVDTVHCVAIIALPASRWPWPWQRRWLCSSSDPSTSSTSSPPSPSTASPTSCWWSSPSPPPVSSPAKTESNQQLSNLASHQNIIQLSMVCVATQPSFSPYPYKSAWMESKIHLQIWGLPMIPATSLAD